MVILIKHVEVILQNCIIFFPGSQYFEADAETHEGNHQTWYRLHPFSCSLRCQWAMKMPPPLLINFSGMLMMWPSLYIHLHRGNYLAGTQAWIPLACKTRGMQARRGNSPRNGFGKWKENSECNFSAENSLNVFLLKVIVQILCVPCVGNRTFVDWKLKHCSLDMEKQQDRDTDRGIQCIHRCMEVICQFELQMPQSYYYQRLNILLIG